MSELPMRGHFRYLRFKTFSTTPRTPQCEVFCSLLSSSKHSGVPEDSKSPNFSKCWASPPHLAKVGLRQTLIQSTYNSGNVTTWHLDQVHLPIFNTLHFNRNVGGEEVSCNLTQVVSNTLGGTSTSRETIITFYKFA